MEILLRHQITRAFLRLGRLHAVALTRVGDAGREHPDGDHGDGAQRVRPHLSPGAVRSAPQLGAGGELPLRQLGNGPHLPIHSGRPTTPIIGSFYDADFGGYTREIGAPASARNPAFSQLDARVERTLHVRDLDLGIYLDVQNVLYRDNPEGTLYDYRYRESAPCAVCPSCRSWACGAVLRRRAGLTGTLARTAPALALASARRLGHRLHELSGPVDRRRSARARGGDRSAGDHPRRRPQRSDDARGQPGQQSAHHGDPAHRRPAGGPPPVTYTILGCPNNPFAASPPAGMGAAGFRRAARAPRSAARFATRAARTPGPSSTRRFRRGPAPPCSCRPSSWPRRFEPTYSPISTATFTGASISASR